MRCKWLREDGTCALDGTRCPKGCEYFEPEERPQQAAGGGDRDGEPEGDVWAIPAGVAAPFGLTEEAGGLDYHVGGGQTFERCWNGGQKSAEGQVSGRAVQEVRDRDQERRGNLQGGVNLIRGLRCQAHGCKRPATRKVWVVRIIRYPLKEVEPGLKAEIGPSGERGSHHVVREVPLCDHHINKIMSQPVNITGMVYDLWSF